MRSSIFTDVHVKTGRISFHRSLFTHINILFVIKYKKRGKSVSAIPDSLIQIELFRFITELKFSSVECKHNREQ